MLKAVEDYVDDNNDYYYTIARHLDALGRIDEAIAAYEKSIEIMPTSIAYGRVCSLKKYTVGHPDFEVRVSLLAWKLGHWWHASRFFPPNFSGTGTPLWVTLSK